METMFPLRVDDLSKHFGGIAALRRFSFEVRGGEVRAIIGPNGAGKTTLFKLICGELSPSAGNIYLFGQNVNSMPLHHRIRLGIGRTFQKTSLFPNLSVLENIFLALEPKNLGFGAFGLAKRNSLYKAKELLEQFNLLKKENSSVKELSYGEQRQIEIILAFALEPKLMLLDEPSAGLSTAEVDPVVQMILSLRSQTATVVIEHDMDVVFKLADFITVLHFGEKISEGTKEKIGLDPKVREIYLGRDASA
jgi:branched-chain amino acid transport system ATP-binding protein